MVPSRSHFCLLFGVLFLVAPTLGTSSQLSILSITYEDGNNINALVPNTTYHLSVKLSAEVHHTSMLQCNLTAVGLPGSSTTVLVDGTLGKNEFTKVSCVSELALMAALVPGAHLLVSLNIEYASSTGEPPYTTPGFYLGLMDALAVSPSSLTFGKSATMTINGTGFCNCKPCVCVFEGVTAFNKHGHGDRGGPIALNLRRHKGDGALEGSGDGGDKDDSGTIVKGDSGFGRDSSVLGGERSSTGTAYVTSSAYNVDGVTTAATVVSDTVLTCESPSVRTVNKKEVAFTVAIHPKGSSSYIFAKSLPFSYSPANANNNNNNNDNDKNVDDDSAVDRDTIRWEEDSVEKESEPLWKRVEEKSVEEVGALKWPPVMSPRLYRGGEGAFLQEGGGWGEAIPSNGEQGATFSSSTSGGSTSSTASSSGTLPATCAPFLPPSPPSPSPPPPSPPPSPHPPPPPHHPHHPVTTTTTGGSGLATTGLSPTGSPSSMSPPSPPTPSSSPSSSAQHSGGGGGGGGGKSDKRPFPVVTVVAVSVSAGLFCICCLVTLCVRCCLQSVTDSSYRSISDEQAALVAEALANANLQFANVGSVYDTPGDDGSQEPLFNSGSRTAPPTVPSPSRPYVPSSSYGATSSAPAPVIGKSYAYQPSSTKATDYLAQDDDRPHSSMLF